MRFFAIIGLSILSAVLYGIIHDQITIRICPEYFTVAHPRLIQTQSLTLLAIFWGVFATWWVGLPLGVLLGIAARAGRWPRLPPTMVARHIAVLLVVIGVLAAIAGIFAYLIRLGDELVPSFAAEIGEHMRYRYMAAWAMHATSYHAGVVGGVVLAIVILAKRRRLAKSARSV